MSAPVESARSHIKQSLTSLQAGQESLQRFVIDLFADLDLLRQKLSEAESQLNQERQRLAQERAELAQQQAMQQLHQSEFDQTLQAKMEELNQDRQALEEELAEVRTRSVAMAETIAEQKREMAEEHAEWAAELRQLRRSLDKQASWVTEQSESAPATVAEPNVPPRPRQTASSADRPPAGNASRNGSNRSRIIPVNDAVGTELA